MKAMISHHSSAILTSKEANIKNPEVKALSEQIMESQKEEIEQMKNMKAHSKFEQIKNQNVIYSPENH